VSSSQQVERLRIISNIFGKRVENNEMSGKEWL